MKGNNRKVQIALEDDNIVHIISEINQSKYKTNHVIYCAPSKVRHIKGTLAIISISEDA